MEETKKSARFLCLVDAATTCECTCTLSNIVAHSELLIILIFSRDAVHLPFVQFLCLDLCIALRFYPRKPNTRMVCGHSKLHGLFKETGRDRDILWFWFWSGIRSAMWGTLTSTSFTSQSMSALLIWKWMLVCLAFLPYTVNRLQNRYVFGWVFLYAVCDCFCCCTTNYDSNDTDDSPEIFTQLLEITTVIICHLFKVFQDDTSCFSISNARI